MAFRAGSVGPSAPFDGAIEHGRPLELRPLTGSYAFYKAFTDAERRSFTLMAP
jgi:hypothetical protein